MRGSGKGIAMIEIDTVKSGTVAYLELSSLNICKYFRPHFASILGQKIFKRMKIKVFKF